MVAAQSDVVVIAMVMLCMVVMDRGRKAQWQLKHDSWDFL